MKKYNSGSRMYNLSVQAVQQPSWSTEADGKQGIRVVWLSAAPSDQQAGWLGRFDCKSVSIMDRTWILGILQ